MRKLNCTFFISIPFSLIILCGCRQNSPSIIVTQSEVSALYAQLREGYGTADTTTALTTVQRMFAYPMPQDDTKPIHIRTLNNGLLQLMYCYFYAEESDAGFHYFLRLAYDTKPPLPVSKENKRQILILAAYLGMQSGEQPKAVECLEQGLQLPAPPTPDERYADYTFAASVYSQTKGAIAKSIQMYEKAWVEVKLSKDKSGQPWILSNLAELYADQGLYDKAVQMHYKSLDLFKADNNNEGAASVCTSIAQLHRQWGMTEQAEKYAEKGVHYAQLSTHSYTIGYCLLEKYQIAEIKQQNDSALFWLQCADSCFLSSNSPVEHLSTQGFITRLLLRDSTYLETGTKQLERICADTLITQSPYHPFLQELLGECYLLLNRNQEGIQLIENSLLQLEKDKRDVSLLNTYRTLIRHFRQEKEYSKAMSYQDKANELREELFKSEKLHQVTASRIQYETTQKELENTILQQKIVLKEHILSFTWALVGLLGALLISGALYMRQRQRYHRKISEARLSRISGLLKAQQELSYRNSSLTDELQKTSRELDEISSEYQILSKRRTASAIRVEISTVIFDSDKEAEFRRNFTVLYPDYLPSLRLLTPGLTRTDELIAMLLLLDLGSDDIALTLGISKNGVNKARSRMRKRLGLATEVKLEEFLKGMLI